MTDYVMPLPVHGLVTTSDYLAVVDGHPRKFPPVQRFSHNNGAYVVLALIAERVSGTEFAELVLTRVCEPAGVSDIEFLRCDEPAERVALGYLGGNLRTDFLHLRSAAAATEDLHHGGGRQQAVVRDVRRSPSAAGAADGVAPLAQRRAVGVGTLRARVLATAAGRGRHPGRQ